MKFKLCAITLVLMSGCSNQPVASNEPFIIRTAERPSGESCEGSHLIISYLQPSPQTMTAIWGYEATGKPGKYKVHYSRRNLDLVRGECQNLDEVYIHSEKSIPINLEGGTSYTIREASGGKVVIRKSKM